eukprot:gene1957-biopygen2250
MLECFLRFPHRIFPTDLPPTSHRFPIAGTSKAEQRGSGEETRRSGKEERGRGTENGGESFVRRGVVGTTVGRRRRVGAEEEEHARGGGGERKGGGAQGLRSAGLPAWASGMTPSQSPVRGNRMPIEYPLGRIPVMTSPVAFMTS